ncbi:hypothetical protein J6590_101728 [Homalodisca vitripennis]|nr:hypothetical protein J6590_101728 [Homalodisca vitripennis]
MNRKIDFFRKKTDRKTLSFIPGLSDESNPVLPSQKLSTSRSWWSCPLLALVPHCRQSPQKLPGNNPRIRHR